MENNIAPKIRFRNYKDTWQETLLSDLVDFSNGINAPKENYGKGRKMISVMDILAEEPIVYDKIRSSVEVSEKIQQENKVEKGDLIFVRSSEVRNEVGWAKAYLQEQFALYSGFSIRGKKKCDYDARFLEYSLNGINRSQIESKAGGSTRYNVSQGVLKNIKMLIPSPEEQLSISKVFEQMENVIAIHRQELETLKQTKQGLLKKMFPKEGETVPEVRFPKFTSQWSEITIGEITESFSGGTPSSGNKSYYGGNIPFIRSAEINSESTELFITEEGLKNSSAKIVSQGTILYAMYGATSGEVGISRIEGAINQAILAIQPIKGDNVNFIYQWLKKNKENIIKSFLQGGQGNLSGSIIKKLSILLPCAEEQLKIGEFFKQLDKTIELQEKELEALKETKKAFLQKMFV